MFDQIQVTYRLQGQATSRSVAVKVDAALFDRLAAAVPEVNWAGASAYGPLAAARTVDAGEVASEADAAAQAFDLAVAAARSAQVRAEAERVEYARRLDQRRQEWLGRLEQQAERARALLGMSDEELEAVLSRQTVVLRGNDKPQVPHWSTTDGPVPLSDAVTVARGVIEVACRRWDAAEVRRTERQAAEAKARQWERAAARAEYLRVLPTLDTNQRARLEAGVLPEGEVLQAVLAYEKTLLPGDLPAYVPIEATEVPQSYDRRPPEWDTGEPETLTSAEWAALEAVRAAVKARGDEAAGYAVSVRYHWGERGKKGGDGGRRGRAAVRVIRKTPVCECRWEYGVPGQDDVVEVWGEDGE